MKRGLWVLTPPPFFCVEYLPKKEAIYGGDCVGNGGFFYVDELASTCVFGSLLFLPESPAIDLLLSLQDSLLRRGRGENSIDLIRFSTRFPLPGDNPQTNWC